jgi:hypothetical protein
MNSAKGPFKTKMVNKLFKKWAENHSALEFAPLTFNQQWIEKNK